MATHDLIRALLRPADNIACVLSVTQSGPEVTRRLIAVITHRDTQLGSLLVLNASAIDVVDAVPITEHLVLAVAQSGPLGSQTAEILPTETSSAWLLTIRRDVQDTRPLAFTVGNYDTQSLQSFTAECRRLKEIANTTHPALADFAWLDAYVSDPSSRRLDLRSRKQPLHTRLSPAIAGLPGDDVSDISIVRRDWIEQTAAKQATSGNVKDLKIRLGTFNVNGKPPSQDLYPWLRSSESQAMAGWISPLKLSPLEFSSDPLHKEIRGNNLSAGATASLQAIGDPDILVLGFQELDLSTEALLYTTSTLKEDEWLAAVLAGLGEKRVLYERLVSRQLVGMLLMVIVKKALVPCFTDVRSCDAGSGIMGFMGNKGATAIRLEFTPQPSSDPQTTCRSTILTFVNAHLAALDEMVERRNYDFQDLSGRLAFSPSGVNETFPPISSVEDSYNIYESDVLFWMVYLNYRLDLPDGDIRKLLFSHVSGIDGIQTLLLYDQLRAAIRGNKAFAGFTEHPITHAPTYRLALAVSKDRLGYDFKRKPAWTDRILHMAAPDVRVAQVAYRSHPEIAMSDHQPVSADFNISLILIGQSQYDNAVSALRRELAGFESSESGPKIKIRPISIELGTVKYQQAVLREAVIQNEGDIPCVFRFVSTGGDSETVSPSWLHIEPMAGLVQPRETMTILLSVYVDKDSAAKLNSGASSLEHTLILHTALGKDYFLPVSGHYQYTCFVNTLERLIRLDGPIGKLKSPGGATSAGQAINAPREVMRLINWMMAHITATDAWLFEQTADERLCHVIRECLDTGDEFPSESPGGDGRALAAAVASTLVAFLDSLIEPVVPPRLHARCLQVRDKNEAFEVLDAFPHESINVWISLTAFLHYIVQQGGSGEDVDPGRAERLASIFAPILLRDDPTSVHPRASPVGKQDFILHFIN